MGSEHWLTFRLHLRVWGAGPLSPMGRLADGHPMRREETLVKRPEKNSGPKEEWGVEGGDFLWCVERAGGDVFGVKAMDKSQSHFCKMSSTERPNIGRWSRWSRWSQYKSWKRRGYVGCSWHDELKLSLLWCGGSEHSASCPFNGNRFYASQAWYRADCHRSILADGDDVLITFAKGVLDSKGGVLWSLESGAGVLHEFLLVNLVGMTHCRTHAGCMQELLQGLTLTFQQVG